MIDCPSMRIRTVYHIVRKYGLIDFIKIAAEILVGKLTNRRVNKWFYDSAVQARLPYFGEYLGARQGVLRRHAFMSRLARQEFQPGREYRILEVGSYAGASAITWALALKENGASGEVFCVDPWDDYLGDSANGADNSMILKEMASALKTGKVRALFNHNISAMGLNDYIRPVTGRFEDVVLQLPEKSFDMIYIDANHAYSAVRSDLERAKALLKPGGLLCGDDLDEQWHNVDHAHCSANAEHDVTVDPKTSKNIHPGVCKAVFEFFGGEVSCFNGFFAMRQDSRGWRAIPDLGAYRLQDLPAQLRWWNIKTTSWLHKRFQVLFGGRSIGAGRF